MRAISAIALVFLVQGCASVDGSLHLTPREVNEQAAELHGRHVTVHGFLNIGGPNHSITNSRNFISEFQAYLEDGGRDFSAYNMNCLTLLSYGGLDHRRDQTHIILEGVIDANYNDGSVVDLGACGGPAALDLAPSSLSEARTPH